MKRLLDAFNSWFVSDAGVWHTLLVTLGIVVAERFTGFDPNGFWLLYWLTIYSAVTQPALARAGRVNEEQQQMILIRLEEAEAKELMILDKLQGKEKP